MSRGEYSNSSSFKCIVGNIELSPETRALSVAAEDEYVERNIELQYKHEFHRRVLERHFKHLLSYMYEEYRLNPKLGRLVFDYHYARIHNQEARHGEA